jgi:hypothetical protein
MLEGDTRQTLTTERCVSQEGERTDKQFHWESSHRNLMLRVSSRLGVKAPQKINQTAKCETFEHGAECRCCFVSL